jgi:curved DNA-binding protein CbpA
MKDPFQVLGVSDTANDEAIKKAYLQKVREFPPDREPERFQTIRSAFDTIKTQRNRLHYELFHTEPPDLNTLLEEWLPVGSRQRPSLELLQQTLLRSLIEGAD